MSSKSSSICLLLSIVLILQRFDCATVLLDNTTSEYVWDLEIRLFGNPSGPFKMQKGGTVTVDITSTQVMDSSHNTCQHIDEMFYLQIYILNGDEFAAVSDESNPQKNCYHENWAYFDAQNCFYYTKATQKYAIALGDSLHTTQPIAASAEYHILVVNPCKVSYNIQGQIMLKNPWNSFEHLDVSHRWHPQIVLIAVIFYVCGLVAWSLCLCVNRRHILIHHRLLTLLLGARGAAYLVYYLSFMFYNQSGISSAFDILFYEILSSVFEVIGFFFLLIVSMGYIVYRPSLDMKQMKVAVLSIFTYGVVCILDETCFLFYDYCHFIELFQFIIRCFLLVGIVALLNALISSVHSGLRQLHWREELKQAYLLLHAHKILRFAFYIYVIGPITVYILYLSVFHWTEQWLYYMINCDIIEPALLAYIYYHFRPTSYFVHVSGIL